MLERQALREVLRGQARARARRRGPAPAAGAAACPRPPPRGELARIARSDAPERLLVGVRAHADLDGVAAELRALGARARALRDRPGCWPRPSPPGRAAVAALRGDPRVAVHRARPRRCAPRPTSSTRSTPLTGIKYTWAYDAVRAGEAIAAVGGGSAGPWPVIDTGLDVTHPEFAGQIAAHLRHRLGQRRRDRLRRATARS